MADVFDLPLFPPVEPRKSSPPPYAWEHRNYTRVVKVGRTEVKNPLYYNWNDFLVWEDQYYWDE